MEGWACGLVDRWAGAWMDGWMDVLLLALEKMGGSSWYLSLSNIDQFLVLINIGAPEI
jgi:hypothetical protein